MLPELHVPESVLRESDTGEPKTICLLHGLFGRVSNWDSTWRFFKDRYRMLALDFDLYDRNAPYHSISTLTGFTLDAMDRHGIGRLVAFGNSLGGQVALNLALHHPERVVALVLTGSAGLVERGYSQVPSRPNLAYARERVEQVFFDKKHATEELYMEVFEAIQSARNKLRFIKLARSSRALNMYDHLPEIDTPALLVWGNQDTVTPPEVGHTFANRMPNARLFFIDLCGHAPNIEQPDQLNVAAADFLQSIGY
jgi:pimeloyl-ACP methyl ester carboxylesterase